MYNFTSSLDSNAVLKERFVWLLYLGIVFFLLYGSANNYAFLTSPHSSYYMEWEQSIPFIEVFIVPYMSSDLVFIIAFLLPQTRFEVRVLALRSFSIILLSVIIFVLFPLEFAFDKPETNNFMFEMLKLDLPYNQMPSLHISLAIILWLSIKKSISSKLLKSLVLIWFILISLSTLFVYQHHFIDIPTAIFLALLVIYFIPAKKTRLFTKQFTTPRSLKIALYYLCISVVSIIFSFYFSSFVLFYISFSFFILSFIYAFGLSFILVNKKGRANLSQWFVFTPYFIGSYLSWLYYKRKIPLYSKLNDSIYFGRQPSSLEYESLKKLGITKIINLATELQIQKVSIEEKRFSFLDITIQDPKKMIEVLNEINVSKNEKIYIHCKLGMSRSILVIYAYLLNEGLKVQDIKHLLKSIRPIYLESKYMDVNLNLYLEFLKISNDLPKKGD